MDEAVTTRPTAHELSDASKALRDMAAAKIVSCKAARSMPATIACAIALQAGEQFASDNAAKLAFGVCVTTNVRKRWLPRLRLLTESRRAEPEIIDADKPPVQAHEPFTCRHQPSCRDAIAHKALCSANTALRRERWRVAHLPPPRAPRPELEPPPQPPPKPPPRRCEGTTRLDEPCQVHERHGMDSATPLRSGGRFCAHHHPDKFTGAQCKGVTKRGGRCRVFSGSLYKAAAPLRNGEELCALHSLQAAERVFCAGATGRGHGTRCRISSWAPFPDAAPLRHGRRFCATHAYQSRDFVRCDGLTRTRAMCRVTSWHDHAGAQPLRDGKLYCAKHADQAGSVPAGAVCAACRATRGLSKDPSDTDGTSWYCQPCWDQWERDDPLAAVWHTLFAGFASLEG